MGRPNKVGSCSGNSPLPSHKKRMKLDCCSPGILPSCISSTVPSGSQSNPPLRCTPCTPPDSGTPSNLPRNTTGIGWRCYWGNIHCLHHSQCMRSQHNWHSFRSCTSSTGQSGSVGIHWPHHSWCNLNSYSSSSGRFRTVRTVPSFPRLNSHLLHHTPCTSPNWHS